MQKYRKKPVVIEAVQLSSINCREVAKWISPTPELNYYTGDPQIIIKTLEGNMAANVGDWIIRGVNGEFYPCNPDIFEKTYEPVTEDE